MALTVSLLLLLFSFLAILSPSIADSDDKGTYNQQLINMLSSYVPHTTMLAPSENVRRARYGGRSHSNYPPYHQHRRAQTISGSEMQKQFGITPGTSLREFLEIVGKNILLFLDIAAKQVNQGINKVLANINKHDDGGINVPAATTMGSAAGMMATQFLGQFFRERWTGIAAHVVQEAVDGFVNGSEEFYAKATSRV